MNGKELLRIQAELQKEAYEVLDALGVMDCIARFGKSEIVGSLALDLMTWPDIDIELVNEINEANYWKTVQHIFLKSDLKGIFIMDYRSSVNPNTPKGLYIGIQYYGKQKDPWKIDIWFMPPREPNAENLNEWLKNSLKEEHKLPILEIKSKISSHPKYRKEVFSIDIYKAVIDRGVRDLEEFKKYLQETKRGLD